MQKEHELLAKPFCQWMRIQYPKILWYKNDNEGQRSFALAQYLRSEGLLAGVPDVTILYRTTRYSGMFIEFKIKPNKPSNAQLSFIGRAQSQGFYCVVVYSLDDAIMEVSRYINGEL